MHAQGIPLLFGTPSAGRAMVAVLLASLLASSSAHAWSPSTPAPPEVPAASATTAASPPPYPTAPANSDAAVPPAYPQQATPKSVPAYPPPPGQPAAGMVPVAPTPAAPAPPGYAPSPGAQTSPPVNPNLPYWQAGAVYVELRSDDPLTRIDRVVGNDATPVCFVPCRKFLDRNSIYVIQGDGIRSTSRFVLPDDRPQVTLDVQAGSSTRMTAGALLLLGGVTIAYIGSLISLAASDPIVPSADTQDNSRSGARTTGLVMLGIALPAAAIGFYLTMTTKTRVTSSSGAVFSDTAPEARRKSSSIAFTARGLEF